MDDRAMDAVLAELVQQCGMEGVLGGVRRLLRAEAAELRQLDSGGNGEDAATALEVDALADVVLDVESSYGGLVVRE